MLLQGNGENLIVEPGNTVACGAGSATYDPVSNTLALNDAEITTENPNRAGISAEIYSDLNIVLNGVNSLASNLYLGIYISNPELVPGETNNSKVTFFGEGTLYIESREPIYIHADTIFDGVFVTTKTEQSSATSEYPGAFSTNNIRVSDSVLLAQSTGDYAVWAKGDLSIAGDSYIEAIGGTGSIGANGKFTIAPIQDKAVDVQVGTDENNTTSLAGSPFYEETDLKALDAGKNLYFYSAENVPQPPTITAGGGFNYQVSASNDMALTCDGKLEDLINIQVDGLILDSSNYTLKSGSTILTLKASYLDTLNAGTHTLKFLYKDNISADTTFTIIAKSEMAGTAKAPETRDTSNILKYLLFLDV